MIRRANLKDIDCLMEIENSCFSKPYSYETFLSDLQNDKIAIFVNEQSGNIIGFISVYCFMGEANLQQIAVLEKHRGKKVAQNLILHSIDYLKEIKAEKYYLEVNEQNQIAIRIYEKLGFKKVVTRKNYYGNKSAIVYEMLL